MLGSYLRTAKYNSGISQAELALKVYEMSGRYTRQADISYFENGKKYPTLGQLVSICRILKVPVELAIAEFEKEFDKSRRKKNAYQKKKKGQVRKNIPALIFNYLTSKTTS